MRNDAVNIDIGKQFSRLPAGRTPSDGKYCGETFRERFLVTNMAAGRTVIIALDGVLSYGSSFLEEAFGGLVRIYSYEPMFLKKHLALKSADPYLIDEIWHYIDDAKLKALPQ